MLNLFFLFLLILLKTRHVVMSSPTTEGKRNAPTFIDPTPSDIDIAQSVKLTPVKELFQREFGLTEDEILPYVGLLCLS